MTKKNLAEKKIFAQESKLMFGQVREDAAVDLYLVGQIKDLKRVLVIASGGCTAFSILSSHNCRVDALDINGPQIALVELKKLVFQKLGFETGRQACITDARHIFDQVKSSLSAESFRLLEPIRNHFDNGFNRAGWVDRSMVQLSRLFFVLFHSRERTEEFLSMNDPKGQSDFFESKWNNGAWRLAMRVAFNKTFLQIRHGAVAKQLVPDDFSAIMTERLKRSLTQFPNRTNPYIWQAFLGRYQGQEDAFPPYLQKNSSETLIANLQNLHLNLDDIIGWLGKQESSSIDYFGLSNVVELLPPAYAEALLPEITRCARPGAMICVRAIFPKRDGRTFAERVDTRQEEVCGQIVFDENLTKSAQEMDRSLFCNFYEVYRYHPANSRNR